jgi:transcriptional regulator with GAF, ATPase, and Fis domain
MVSSNGEVPHLRPQAVPRGISQPARAVASAPAEVVLADPDRDRAASLLRVLTPELRVVYESRLEDVERHCREGQVAAVVLPLHWSGSPRSATAESLAVSDTPLLHLLRAYGQRLAIVVYGDTGHLPLEVYCRPLAAGARQVLNERAATFAEDLKQTVRRLVSDRQAHLHERDQLRALFAEHGLLGQSLALEEVFRTAVKASYFSHLPVLLTGETGTGKQRLAEAIHTLDADRRGKPFVTLNCSALSKTLAESELFGHTRGAFSGAQGERLGLFRSADGGTLLLDEVGELDLELQPKLLRVLQERLLLPVGEDAEQPVDVRILAATNRPLEQMVAEGKFRADLYQRLNVFRIRIPPLRERPEDIEVQARHFLQRYQQERIQPVQDFGPRVLEALRLLPWEGNSRQLENLIRELLAHKEGGARVELEDLPRWVLESLAHLPTAPLPVPAGPAFRSDLALPRRSLSAALEEFERCFLQTVLKQHGGNRTRTAAELGLTPRSIFNKIKKYGLE